MLLRWRSIISFFFARRHSERWEGDLHHLLLLRSSSVAGASSSPANSGKSFPRLLYLLLIGVKVRVTRSVFRLAQFVQGEILVSPSQFRRPFRQPCSPGESQLVSSLRLQCRSSLWAVLRAEFKSVGVECRCTAAASVPASRGVAGPC